MVILAAFGFWRLSANSDDGGPTAQYVPSKRTTTVVTGSGSPGAGGEMASTTVPLTNPTAATDPSPSATAPSPGQGSPSVTDSPPQGGGTTTTTARTEAPAPRPSGPGVRGGAGVDGGLGGEAGG